MFMHGDKFYIGNMWFLLVFGRSQCARATGDSGLFACGVCASLAHIFSDLHSILPCLGASGAISGIMGAYVSIHPFNKIKIWFGWWLGVIEVPAICVIGLWFLLQYLSAFWAMEDGISDGVAYWAHLGGFCAGFAILRGVVFYLRRHPTVGNGDDEPLAPREKDLLLVPQPQETVANPLEENAVQEGAPDPFSHVLSVQAIRRCSKKRKRESR